MNAIATSAHSRRTALLVATVLAALAWLSAPPSASPIGPGVDQYFPAGGREDGPGDGSPGSANGGGGIGETPAGAAARRAAADAAPKGTGTIPILGYPATPLVDVLLVLVLAALGVRAFIAIRSRTAGSG